MPQNKAKQNKTEINVNSMWENEKFAGGNLNGTAALENGR